MRAGQFPRIMYRFPTADDWAFSYIASVKVIAGQKKKQKQDGSHLFFKKKKAPATGAALWRFQSRRKHFSSPIFYRDLWHFEGPLLSASATTTCALIKRCAGWKEMDTFTRLNAVQTRFYVSRRLRRAGGGHTTEGDGIHQSRYLPVIRGGIL